MKSFKDNENRSWDIVVNVFTAKAVRSLTAVDIFKLHTTEAERVFSDPCLLVDVVYVLCKEQCEKRKMSDEEFGRALVGDHLEYAANALLEEVANFFPSQRRNLLLKQTVKAVELSDKVMEQANLILDTMNVESLMHSKVSTKSVE